jgi:hypothetical protein
MGGTTYCWNATDSYVRAMESPTAPGAEHLNPADEKGQDDAVRRRASGGINVQKFAHKTRFPSLFRSEHATKNLA